MRFLGETESQSDASKVRGLTGRGVQERECESEKLIV